tara:strand:- start:62 stop:601 length:540 start_codon:yes stop_codon:yes gene_type:complete
MVSDIIKITYPLLKEVSKGNFKEVKADLDLLGVEYSEDELVKAFTIVSQSNSIDEALNAIDSIDSSSFTKAKTKIKAEQKAEKIKQEKTKKEKAKQRLQQKKEREEKKLAQEQADALNPYKSIIDYKVVAARDYAQLMKFVKMYMKEGWKPYGGVSTYNPGGKIGLVPNSFHQAMVKFK